MNRPLADLRLAVMMLDGIELQGRTNIVALGITTDGDEARARAVGRLDRERHGRTALLADLVDRGLDVEQGLLFVLDGAKALRKAVRQVFGHRRAGTALCGHKERNVLDHLPERDRDAIKRRLR